MLLLKHCFQLSQSTTERFLFGGGSIEYVSKIVNTLKKNLSDTIHKNIHLSTFIIKIRAIYWFIILIMYLFMHVCIYIFYDMAMLVYYC